MKTLTKFKLGKVRWLISMIILASVLSSIAGFWAVSQKTNVQHDTNIESHAGILYLNFKSLGGIQIKESFPFDYNYFLNNENKYNHNLAKSSFALSVSAFSAGDTKLHWGETGNFGREKNLKSSFYELKLEDQIYVGYDN